MLVARTPYTVSELNLAIDWFSGVCAMLFETSTRSTNQLLVLLNLIFGWTNQRLILVLCKFHRFDCFSGEWFRLLDLLYSAIAGVRGRNIVSFMALVTDWCNELIVSSQARSCFPVVVVKHRSWRVQFVLTLIKNVTIMVCLYFLFS